MSNGIQLRTEHKLATLTTIAIVILVVDASVNRALEREESVAYNGETQQAFREDLEERITYEGDQVWRIYKHNDSINELVQRHDEYGCT